MSRRYSAQCLEAKQIQSGNSGNKALNLKRNEAVWGSLGLRVGAARFIGHEPCCGSLGLAAGRSETASSQDMGIGLVPSVWQQVEL